MILSLRPATETGVTTARLSTYPAWSCLSMTRLMVMLEDALPYDGRCNATEMGYLLSVVECLKGAYKLCTRNMVSS